MLVFQNSIHGESILAATPFACLLRKIKTRLEKAIILNA